MASFLVLGAAVFYASAVLSVSAFAPGPRPPVWHPSVPSGPPAPQQLPDSYYKQAVLSVLNSIQSHDPTPAKTYLSVNDIQHNLGFATGQAGFLAFLLSIANSTAKTNIIRVFYDREENVVFTHGTYASGILVAFDTFRFEGQQIHEHWDNLESAAGTNPSGHTQLDGPLTAKVLAPAIVKQNKALVREFVIQAVIAGDASNIAKYVDSSYIEHAVGGTDGITSLSGVISGRSNGQYNVVRQVFGDGNFVLITGEGVKNCNLVAYYDMYRVESSKIVERWSVTEAIPPQNEWKNDNGKF